MSHVITAIIKNAIRNNAGEWSYITGNIFGDIHKRFADNSFIHTSAIMSEEEGDIIVTRNNVYKIESWAPKLNPLDIF